MDTYYENLGGYDCDDEWTRDSTAETHSITGIKEVSNNDYHDVCTTDGDGPFYLLYVIYDTGDSFGTDEGRFEEVLLHRDIEVAKKNKKLIETHYSEYCKKNGFSPDCWNLELSTDEGESVRVCPSWIGYFESLVSVEIERVEIL
jgi:hypothetical protein